VVLADFCYQGPEKSVIEIVNSPNVLLEYYLFCNGTSPFAVYFDESRGYVSDFESYIENVDTYGIQCFQNALDLILITTEATTDTIDAFEDFSACSSINPFFTHVFHGVLCDEIVRGLFILFWARSSVAFALFVTLLVFPMAANTPIHYESPNHFMQIVYKKSKKAAIKLKIAKRLKKFGFSIHNLKEEDYISETTQKVQDNNDEVEELEDGEVRIIHRAEDGDIEMSGWRELIKRSSNKVMFEEWLDDGEVVSDVKSMELVIDEVDKEEQGDEEDEKDEDGEAIEEVKAVESKGNSDVKYVLRRLSPRLDEQQDEDDDGVSDDEEVGNTKKKSNKKSAPVRTTFASLSHHAKTDGEMLTVNPMDALFDGDDFLVATLD
jgi:hypothetical protein